MKNKTLENLLFVLKCPVCGEPLALGREGDGVLCKTCRAKYLFEKEKYCPDCGLRVPDCRCMPRALKRTRAETLLKLVFYDPEHETAANKLILYLKNNRDRRVECFMARELCAALSNYFSNEPKPPDDIVFTHAPRNLWIVNKKGFDQAKILAEECAAFFGAEAENYIRRRLISRRQRGLSVNERRKNAGRAFAISRHCDPSGRTVVLIDDIVTTGETLASCTRLLMKAGAKRVICLSIAKTDGRINGKPKDKHPYMRKTSNI